MAVKTAYVMLNGVKMLATYSESTKLWTAEGNAPASSSWNEPEHVFKAEIHAEDGAGNKTIMTAEDDTYGDQLKFRVLEKTKPTAKIVSPTQDSVLGASNQDIILEIQDAGGSGLNMSSVVFKLNNKAISTGLAWSDGTGGKKTCTYKATNLPDGANKVELQVSDNDGNSSDNVVVNFIISTAAPTLNVTSPADNLITNVNKVTVSGTAAAGSQNVKLAEVTVNSEKVTVGAGGAFSKEVTLTEGDNTINIIAKDNLGKTTTVTRHVKLDTKAPIISEVVADATTIGASGRVRIAFKVIDPE